MTRRLTASRIFGRSCSETTSGSRRRGSLEHHGFRRTPSSATHRSDSVVALRLPDPMLSRSGSLPIGPGWLFEVKWDGFRAIVSTEGDLRVRSRRGWDMTDAVPELGALPSGLVL